MNTAEIGMTLIEVWGKSALVLGVGFVLALVFRNRSAALKSSAWNGIMVSLVLIPAALTLLPRWETIPVRWRIPETLPNSIDSHFELKEIPQTSSATVELPVPRTFRAGIHWQTVLVGVWLAGAAVLLMRSLVGGFWLGRLQRFEGWSPGDIQSLVRRLCQKQGIDPGIGVIVSKRILSPFTWGWLRPRIGLPQDALNWSPGDIEMVLLHELEHIRRRDALAVLVSRTVLILNWLNPLAWLALRTAESCREEACDDGVLASGHRPRNYANLLFQQARSVPAPFKSWATAVAETGTLERRIKMILKNNSNSHRAPQSRITGWLMGGPLLVLGVAIGMAGLTEPGIAKDPKTDPVSQSAKAMATKLKSIVIPNVQFVNTPLGDAIDFLVQRSRELDPDKAGINVILKGSEGMRDLQITLQLTNVPLAEVLKYCALLASARLEVDDYAVLIVENKPGDPETPSPLVDKDADAEVARKLEKIIVPTIEFVDTPLLDALDFLRQRSAELDSDSPEEKKGIDIVLNVPEDSGVDPATVKITLKLNQVPMGAALKYTCSLSGLKSGVKNGAVLIQPE